MLHAIVFALANLLFVALGALVAIPALPLVFGPMPAGRTMPVEGVVGSLAEHFYSGLYDIFFLREVERVEISARFVSAVPPLV